MQKKWPSVKAFAAVALFFSIANATHAQRGAGIPSGGNPNCIPPDVFHNQGSGQQQYNNIQRPIIIRQKWADRWGALIYDQVNPVLGVSYGLNSKREAVAAAVADCKAKGGGVLSHLYFIINALHLLQ